jgi:ribosome-associated protein
MTQLDTTALARTLAEVATDKLARDVRLIDLRGVVSYTDYFVVCTGQNPRQTKAISDHVISEMQDKGYKRPRRRESDPEGTWLLLDYVDVVLHIFTPEARDFYRLESLWGQVPQEAFGDAHHGRAAGDSATAPTLASAESREA